MNRAVTYARLQTNLYAPGVGELGTVLPHPSKTFDNFNMTATDNDLLVSFLYKGKHWEILVPKTNVAIMILAPETPPTGYVKLTKAS